MGLTRLTVKSGHLAATPLNNGSAAQPERGQANGTGVTYIGIQYVCWDAVDEYRDFQLQTDPFYLQMTVRTKWPSGTLRSVG